MHLSFGSDKNHLWRAKDMYKDSRFLVRDCSAEAAKIWQLQQQLVQSETGLRAKTYFKEAKGHSVWQELSANHSLAQIKL